MPAGFCMLALEAFSNPEGEWHLLLVPKAVFWEAWCLHFGTLSCHFGIVFCTLGHPWGLWEQDEGHVGVQSLNFIDVGAIFGFHLESLLGTEG